MSTSRDEDLIEDHGPGEVVMTVCRICGFEWWTCTHAKDGDGNAIPDKVTRLAQASGGDASNHHCSRCADVYQRAPEIVAWVLGVVRKART